MDVNYLEQIIAQMRAEMESETSMRTFCFIQLAVDPKIFEFFVFRHSVGRAENAERTACNEGYLKDNVGSCSMR